MSSKEAEKQEAILFFSRFLTFGVDNGKKLHDMLRICTYTRETNKAHKNAPPQDDKRSSSEYSPSLSLSLPSLRDIFVSLNLFDKSVSHLSTG